jgi:ribosomal protein S18 acetylase RimI-like enzyme
VGTVKPGGGPLVERPLTADDLEAAVGLSAEPGWNQIAADWRLMIDQGLAIGMEAEGRRLVASGLSLPYGDRFAWIAMILVTTAYRRRGIATYVMRRCIEMLQARNLIPALDATPEGRQVYLPLGFKDVYTLTRLIAERPTLPRTPPGDGGVRQMTEADLDAVSDYDREPFGADRRYVLKNLFERMPAAAFVHETEGKIDGFVLVRDGRLCAQVGPLAADHEEHALALVWHALAALDGPVCLDVADHHRGLLNWLRRRGCADLLPFIRMIQGRSEPLDNPERVFVIAGPELG